MQSPLAITDEAVITYGGDPDLSPIANDVTMSGFDSELLEAAMQQVEQAQQLQDMILTNRIVTRDSPSHEDPGESGDPGKHSASSKPKTAERSFPEYSPAAEILQSEAEVDMLREETQPESAVANELFEASPMEKQAVYGANERADEEPGHEEEHEELGEEEDEKHELEEQEIQEEDNEQEAAEDTEAAEAESPVTTERQQQDEVNAEDNERTSMTANPEQRGLEEHQLGLSVDLQIVQGFDEAGGAPPFASLQPSSAEVYEYMPTSDGRSGTAELFGLGQENGSGYAHYTPLHSVADGQVEASASIEPLDAEGAPLRALPSSKESAFLSEQNPVPPENGSTMEANATLAAGVTPDRSVTESLGEENVHNEAALEAQNERVRSPAQQSHRTMTADSQSLTDGSPITASATPIIPEYAPHAALTMHDIGEADFDVLPGEAAQIDAEDLQHVGVPGELMPPHVVER